MIRALTETDGPSGFSCGSPELDRYLRKHALANVKAGVSVTYVHVSTQGRIDGFVTVAGTSIRAADAACLAHLPGYPLPALLIARLGVDARSQGQGIGRSLLAFALGIAVIARERLGCVGGGGRRQRWSGVLLRAPGLRATRTGVPVIRDDQNAIGDWLSPRRS